MHADDLARRRDFKALLGTAMGLQFLFRFRRIAWHGFPILSLPAGQSQPLQVSIWELLRPVGSRQTLITTRWSALAREAEPWPPHPSSVPAAPPERFLPCAAAFLPGPVLRFPPAAGSSWRARLPGAPFRGHDERSWRAPCGPPPGTSGSGSCEPENRAPR